MDLRQLEYFVAVAEEQHFTRAAALSGVSQSGLSAAIRSLEEELGVPLFHRTTRQVAPTDAGRALLPHARALLGQAAAAQDAIRRASGELTGSLRVGAEQCLGFVDVPALLERVHRCHPLLDVDFTQAGTLELAGLVRDGELDVAFVAGVEHLGRVHRTEIGRRPVVLLCPPGHRLAAAGPVQWADLQGEDFVDFQTGWGIRTLNDVAAAAHGAGRRVRCTVNDVHTLLDLVHRGMGIALVPQHLAAKPQAAGLAVVPLPGGVTPEWVVCAITAPSRPPAAGLLLDLLDAEAARVG